MIRRLGIAQAALHRPHVLFLDEPTVGLDPLARQVVWNHLAQIRAELGTTIFLTTHYMVIVNFSRLQNFLGEKDALVLLSIGVFLMSARESLKRAV